MAAAPQDHNERAVALGEALVHAPDGVDDEVARGHGAGLPLQPRRRSGPSSPSGSAGGSPQSLTSCLRGIDGVRGGREQGADEPCSNSSLA